MQLSFRAILLSACTTIAAFLAVVYTACNKDRCGSVVCAYGGVCNNGTCICLPGYEGVNCETITRLKFIGYWDVYEDGSTTSAAQYQLSVDRNDTLVQNVRIRNLFNYFNSSPYINATVKGDTMFIPSQQIMGKVVVGVSYIYNSPIYGVNSALNLSYEVIDTATGQVDNFGYGPSPVTGPSEWNR